ncbi:MAG: dUTP diphosphatase [Bacillota bacterium]
MKIEIKQIDKSINLPEYQHPGEDAGMDLIAAESCNLTGGNYRMIKTGIKIAIPEGYGGFVYPRSGLAKDYGVTVLNSPGVIDSGYRGEVGVILINHSREDFQIKKGARIAQLIIHPVKEIVWEEVDKLPDSYRKSTGFGDSGII